MNWTKRFDPDGKDSVYIAKKYTDRIESFLKQAGYEVKDGLKYARTVHDPILGDCWVFPAMVVIIEGDSKSN